MSNQIRAALEYKWFKGIKIGKDPGPEAISEWINEYAEKYRKDYEKCLEKLLVDVAAEARKRTPSVCPTCNEEKINALTKIIIEEFTKKWFIEMTKTDHDQHIEEI